MKLFKSFLFNVLFFIFTTLSIILLNLYPLITLAKKSPPGRTYSLIHNNTQDFYFYQALMNEGANGHWLIYDPYTTEDSRPSVIFSYFTVLGKLSRLLRLPYAYTYHIFRILSSVLFFLAAFRLIYFLALPNPGLTYLFFLLSAPFFNVESPYMYWWTGMDPVRRAAYLPHHMFGGFLLIVSVMLILRFYSSKKVKFLLFAFPLSLVMAFVHTPSLIILLIVLPPTVILYILLNYKIIKLFGNFKWFFIYWIVGLLSLAFMVSQTNKGFPWNQYLLWERSLQYPLDKELFGALGMLLPFGLLGAIIALLSRKFESVFVATWFAFPLLLIPVASKLGMSNIRLIQGIPYLSLAILAITGIDYLINKLVNIPSVIQFAKQNEFTEGYTDTLINKFKYQRYKKFINLRLAVYWIIAVLFFAYSSRLISWSVKDQIREYSPIFGNTYLDDRLHRAFAFINNNYPPKTTTVSTFYAGNYLPVFTDTVSFIGHTGYTYNLAGKEPEVQKFFSSKMSPEEAKSFIMNNKITLVFQGPEEKILYPDYLYPGILIPVYDRPDTAIYELKK